MSAAGMTSPAKAAAALLAWYREMGVDAVVSDESIDWLARGDVRPGAGFELPAAPVATSPIPAASPRPAPASPPPQTPRRPPMLTPVPSAAAPRAALPPDDSVLAARSAAAGAATIDDLARILAGFDGCALKKTAKSLCFYRGAVPARVMVIGEAPGADEDKIGKPFVGPAGQLLDRMLLPIGLDERSVHITNTVYWRPPGNRTPTPQETQVCRPFLERQVELVKPEVIVLLGGAAANQVLALPDGIMRLRGKWHEVTLGRHTARAIATLHPAYLLRSPVSKRLAWRDLLAIEAALKG